MYNHETKLWHRLVAFLLSFVMVLGMLPANVVFAEELPEQEVPETVALGTVEAVPAVGTVDGSTVTFSGVTLETADAESGWQIGAKVTAPEGAALESAVISGEYVTEGNAVLLTVVLTKDAAISGQKLTSSWNIDWNGDNTVDQTVVVTADPAALVLTENGTEVFPAPYGVGTVTGMLENAEGILETFAAEDGVANFSGKTLDWKPIDEEKDRTREGWWIGVRVDAPAGMDQAALELAQCGPKNGAKGSFWSQKDTEDGSYLTFWCLVNEEYLEKYNPLSYTWVFDWNGDGHFEQTVKAMVDPANVTLVKNGEKVYPTVAVTAEVTGAGTVKIDGQNVGEGMKVVKGQEVTITVTPGENERITSLTIGDQEITGQDYNTAVYEGKFTFTEDTVIKVSFVTEYTVTFETNAGAFTDETGATTLTSLTVSPNGEVKFKLANIKDGYTAVVKDNGTEITAVDGVYTISNINENHSITAVVTDTTAPVFGSVSVADNDKWTTCKFITFSATDNSGEAVTYYVSTDENADLSTLIPVTSPYKVETACGADGVTYYLFAMDAAGNVSDASSVAVMLIDVTSPVFSNYDREENRNWFLPWIIEDVTYSFNVSDPESGIVRVWYSTDSTGANGTTVEAENGLYTFTVDENETYYIFAENGAGKVVAYNSNGDTVDVFDKAVPVISNVKFDTKNYQKDKITVTFTAQDNLNGVISGIAAAYYSSSSEFDDTAILIADPDPENTDVKAEKKYSFELTENGTYYIYVVDNSNNIAKHEFKINNIDNKVPVLTVTMEAGEDKDKVAYTGDWTNKKVTVKINASDDLSGVDEVYYSTTEPKFDGDKRPDGKKAQYSNKDKVYRFSVEQECNVTYYIWAYDELDHVSTVATVTVKIDKTAPEVNDVQILTKQSQTDEDDEFYLKYYGTIVLKVDAKDNENGSDLVKYEYCLVPISGSAGAWTPFTPDENGQFSVTGQDGFQGRILVRVTDAAGNESDLKRWVKGKTTSVAYRAECSDPATYFYAVYVWFTKNANNPETKLTITTEDGKEYTGEWTKQNVQIKLDSTLTDGVAYYEYSIDGGQNWVALLAINSTSATTNGCSFEIDEDTNASYIFRAVSTQADGEGNTYVGAATEAKAVKVRKTAPDMAELIIDGKRHQDNEWYYSVPSITITAPASAYPNDLIITTEYAVYAPGTADEDKQFHVFSKESENAGKTKSASLNVLELLKAAGGLENGDGYYVIEVRTKDAAGLETSSFYNVTKTVTEDEEGNETIEVNKEEMSSLTFNVDTTAPDVEQMTITYTYEKPVLDENGEPVMVQKKEIVTDDLKDTDDKTFFDKWYNSSIKIELGANFDVSGEVEDSLQYLIVPNYGAYDPTSTDNNWITYNSETGVVIDPNEKFVLIFRAEDAAGNVSYVHSTGIVVDDEAPSADETKNPDVEDTAVIFTIPEADGENDFYVNENGYDIQINVFDPTIKEDLLGDDENNASGLKSITYTLETVEKTDLAQTGKIEIQSEDEDKDENAKPSLIFSQSGTIFVDAKHFDGYTVVLKVVATDNAGNSKTFTSDPMKIDITNPKINIAYDNNAVVNETYYAAQRIATITVTERNFDSSLVKLTVSVYNDATQKYDSFTIPAKWFTDNGLSGDWEQGDTADEWILKVPFVDDNDYKLEISMTDKAGHANDPITFGDDAREENNINAFAFTVDQTNPVINVSYTPATSANGKYFNETRTATVDVIEHNFNPDREAGTRIILTASLDGNAIELPAWAFANIGGDTWRATVVFENDGDYTFDAAATDMAGNTNGNIVNYGNSAVPTAFTIDKTIVQPEVGGVEDGGSYSDEAKPSVDIYDVNYDGYTLTLERINQSGKETVTEEFFDLIEFVAPGGTLRTEDIPHIKENDGIYILTVTITDKAGNISDPRVTTFTVNRFGSIYLPEDSLQKVTDGYNYQIEQDLVMTEINPNLLKDGSVKVQITRDGKPVDAAGVVITPKNPNAEHGWYEYTYTLNKELFTEDGVYKITFLSEDSEGHENQSETITFRVDTTAPELSSVVGLEEPIVNAQEHEVRFTVFDAIGLESISIYINDMEAPAQVISNFDDPNNFTGSFKLFESNDAQSVRIVIRDLAGNELDTGAENFTSAYEFNDRITVSTNWFVRWFANKPLFFGSLAGIGGAGWLLWFLIFGKRKKEEEEEQAV